METDYEKWLEERDKGRPFTEEEVLGYVNKLMENEGMTMDEAVSELQSILDDNVKRSAS